MAKYVIMFDSNGGSNLNPVIKDEGISFTKPNDPVRRIFDGWYRIGIKSIYFSINPIITAVC